MPGLLGFRDALKNEWCEDLLSLDRCNLPTVVQFWLNEEKKHNIIYIGGGAALDENAASNNGGRPRRLPLGNIS